MLSLRRLLPWLVLLVVVLVEPRDARAAVGTVDQQTEAGNGALCIGADNRRSRQQVKAGVTGTLAGVALTLRTTESAPVTFTVRVKRGPAPIDGPLLFSRTFTLTEAVNMRTEFIDMTAANIQLTTDELFTIELGATSPSTTLPCVWQISKGYSEPRYYYLDGTWYLHDGQATVFATYMLPPAALGVSLDASPSPSVTAAPVTLKATVAGGTTGDTVQFFDGSVEIGSASVSAGEATLVTSTLSVGVHSLTARYVPTGTISSPVAHSVAKGSTTTSVATSQSPSLVGHPVTFTATVRATPPAAGTPTGTVTFKEAGNTLGSGALDGAGTASFVATTLAPGAHTIVAEYAGDGDFDASADAVTQLVAQDGTLVDLQASTSPSTYGQSVTFTATLTASAGATTPSGSVTFTDVSTAPPTTLDTVPLVGGGAALTTDALEAGTHVVEVTYGGDAIHEAVSASRVHVVERATSAVALTTSAATTAFGQAVALTATVTSAKGPPSGTVTFAQGELVLGTVPLEAGVATLSTASLPVGSHGIEASYSGDTNHEPSASTATHQVSRASTSTTLLSSSSSSAPGDLVTFTVTVSSSVAGASGDVELFAGAASLGKVPLTTSANALESTAVLSTRALSIGVHDVRAEYVGDATHEPSTSTTVQHAVQHAIDDEDPVARSVNVGGGCQATGRHPAGASPWALVGAGLAALLARRPLRPRRNAPSKRRRA
ncbi:MAG: Ig-like domain repeat protein [Labilithrix sp.]|nr:Ig-like domain repeat protein [Labilithrix sp.]